MGHEFSCWFCIVYMKFAIFFNINHKELNIVFLFFWVIVFRSTTVTLIAGNRLQEKTRFKSFVKIKTHQSTFFFHYEIHNKQSWLTVNFLCISMSLQLSSFGEKQIKHTEATSRQNKLSPCSQRRGEVRTPPQYILRHICAPWPSNDVSFAEEIGQPWIPGSFHLKKIL